MKKEPDNSHKKIWQRRMIRRRKKRGLDKSEREGSTMARHENEIRYPPYRLVPRSQEIEKRSIDTQQQSKDKNVDKSRTDRHIEEKRKKKSNLIKTVWIVEDAELFGKFGSRPNHVLFVYANRPCWKGWNKRYIYIQYHTVPVLYMYIQRWWNSCDSPFALPYPFYEGMKKDTSAPSATGM